MAALAFRVHGRVQGVGFRWWTRLQARRMGIAGTVENVGDGTVLIRAQGPEESLTRLQDSLHEGPPGAEVTRVEAQPWAGDASAEFRIVH